MGEIEYIIGGKELLNQVAPLWEKLRLHHQTICTDFRDVFSNASFAKRLEELERKSVGGKMRVELGRHSNSAIAIAYCISTIDSSTIGEVDSLFVEGPYRSQGVGFDLLTRALRWMDMEGTKEKRVSVAGGNEKAIAFYARQGFIPRSILMVQKGRCTQKTVEHSGKKSDNQNI